MNFAGLQQAIQSYHLDTKISSKDLKSIQQHAKNFQTMPESELASIVEKISHSILKELGLPKNDASLRLVQAMVSSGDIPEASEIKELVTKHASQPDTVLSDEQIKDILKKHKGVPLEQADIENDKPVVKIMNEFKQEILHSELGVAVKEKILDTFEKAKIADEPKNEIKLESMMQAEVKIIEDFATNAVDLKQLEEIKDIIETEIEQELSTSPELKTLDVIIPAVEKALQTVESKQATKNVEANHEPAQIDNEEILKQDVTIKTADPSVLKEELTEWLSEALPNILQENENVLVGKERPKETSKETSKEAPVILSEKISHFLEEKEVSLPAEQFVEEARVFLENVRKESAENFESAITSEIKIAHKAIEPEEEKKTQSEDFFNVQKNIKKEFSENFESVITPEIKIAHKAIESDKSFFSKEKKSQIEDFAKVQPNVEKEPSLNFEASFIAPETKVVHKAKKNNEISLSEEKKSLIESFANEIVAMVASKDENQTDNIKQTPIATTKKLAISVYENLDNLKQSISQAMSYFSEIEAKDVLPKRLVPETIEQKTFAVLEKNVKEFLEKAEKFENTFKPIAQRSNEVESLDSDQFAERFENIETLSFKKISTPNENFVSGSESKIQDERVLSAEPTKMIAVKHDSDAVSSVEVSSPLDAFAHLGDQFLKSLQGVFDEVKLDHVNQVFDASFVKIKNVLSENQIPIPFSSNEVERILESFHVEAKDMKEVNLEQKVPNVHVRKNMQTNVNLAKQYEQESFIPKANALDVFKLESPQKETSDLLHNEVETHLPQMLFFSDHQKNVFDSKEMQNNLADLSEMSRDAVSFIQEYVLKNETEQANGFVQLVKNDTPILNKQDSFEVKETGQTDPHLFEKIESLNDRLVEAIQKIADTIDVQNQNLASGESPLKDVLTEFHMPQKIDLPPTQVLKDVFVEIGSELAKVFEDSEEILLSLESIKNKALPFEGKHNEAVEFLQKILDHLPQNKISRDEPIMMNGLKKDLPDLLVQMRDFFEVTEKDFLRENHSVQILKRIYQSASQAENQIFMKHQDSNALKIEQNQQFQVMLSKSNDQLPVQVQIKKQSSYQNEERKKEYAANIQLDLSNLGVVNSRIYLAGPIKQIFLHFEDPAIKETAEAHQEELKERLAEINFPAQVYFLSQNTKAQSERATSGKNPQGQFDAFA